MRRMVSITPFLRHLGSGSSIEPLRPNKIGLFRLIDQMPPPSLLQQFLDQYPVVALLDVGPEDGIFVAD